MASGCVFGCELSDVASTCVFLKTGSSINIPQIVVELSNLIRKDLSIEGIFRKAGSSQRQSDLKVT